MGTEHPDYVKEYDRLQESRFEKKQTEKEKNVEHPILNFE